MAFSPLSVLSFLSSCVSTFPFFIAYSFVSCLLTYSIVSSSPLSAFSFISSIFIFLAYHPSLAFSHIPLKRPLLCLSPFYPPTPLLFPFPSLSPLSCFLAHSHIVPSPCSAFSFYFLFSYRLTHSPLPRFFPLTLLYVHFSSPLVPFLFRPSWPPPWLLSPARFLFSFPSGRRGPAPRSNPVKGLCRKASAGWKTSAEGRWFACSETR